MSRLRGQAGSTLPELLIAVSLLAGILTAALVTWETFYRNQGDTQRLNDAQDEARSATDLLARELRNLTSPTPDAPLAIDKATDTDLVFKTVDPVGPNSGANNLNLRRARYCLDASNPANGRLMVQYQVWTTQSTPPLPATTSCPAPATTGGFGAASVAAESLVNAYGGPVRPIFRFNSSTLTDITSIRTELFVDVDPTARPGATTLRTGIYLRNQNRAPTASFLLTVSASIAGSTTVVLNASASVDPDGDPLVYTWWDATTNTKLCGGASRVVCTDTLQGSGAHSVYLQARDASGLTTTTATQTVTVA